MLILVTAPVDEIVALDEVKEYLKVEHDEDDALIMEMVKAARLVAEQYTGRAFLTQTWDFILDQPGQEIITPKQPLQSVTSIKSIDDDAVESVVDSADYYLDLSSSRIILKSGESWGSMRERAGWKARIVCGWTDVTLVPDEIKRALKMMVAHAYEFREGEKRTMVEASRGTSYALLTPWRVIQI